MVTLLNSFKMMVTLTVLLGTPLLDLWITRNDRSLTRLAFLKKLILVIVMIAVSCWPFQSDWSFCDQSIANGYTLTFYSETQYKMFISRTSKRTKKIMILMAIAVLRTFSEGILLVLWCCIVRMKMWGYIIMHTGVIIVMIDVNVKPVERGWPCCDISLTNSYKLTF